MRAAAWSPDGTRVAFHKRLHAPPTAWKKVWSRNPDYEMTLTGILPAFNPSGDRFVMTGAAARGRAPGSSIAVASTGTNAATVIYQDKSRNVLAPQWSPTGDTIIFGVGVFNAFFNGFNGLFLKPGDRAEGGAQIAIINPDGSGFREITSGPNNNSFPSMAPDGKRFVYRIIRAGGRRAPDHESRNQGRDDAHDRVRQLPALVAAGRPHHVLAPVRAATTRSTPSSRMAPV